MGTKLSWLAFVAACASSRPAPDPITAKKEEGSAVKPEPAITPEPSIAGRERIHFGPNAASMVAGDEGVLEKVAARLSADSALNLQISGHTEPSERAADDTSPAGLAHARAITVKSYLLSRGIAERRLLVRAVGSKEPRDNNATESGKAANRRVEFERVTIKEDPIGGGRVVVTDTDVEILDHIAFEPGKDVIPPKGLPVLDAVAATLHGNPSILLVEVQSHTDERGDDARNMRLSDARARAVVSYLVGKGIDPTRLTAQGYGETQPIDRRHNEAAWEKNNRIAFLVLKRM